MPPKAKTSTAVVVSRGSQSHHTPQVGLAQIDALHAEQRREHDAHLDRRLEARVPAAVAAQQESERAAEREGEGQHRVPGRGDVDVHDALHVAHVRLARARRKRPQYEPQTSRSDAQTPADRRYGPSTAAPDVIGHQSSTTRPKSRPQSDQ